MYQSTLKSRILRRSLLLGAASAAALAIAAPAAAQGQNVETVVVTGSRIPQQGLYSSSPVTTVGAQDLKLQGATNIGQVMADLPSVVSDGDGQFVNNGSGGISTVDLRGLGNVRTLLLVDGKRLVPSDQFGDVDLNQIPPMLIDHIEVLTGGASAVYGSDAVAGVVNLILRKDFEGLEADVQYKQTDHNDGQTFDGSLMMGVNSADGKGNVTIYGNYQNRQAIMQGNRGYSSEATASPQFTFGAPVGTTCADLGYPSIQGGFCPLGSSASVEGNFVPQDGNAYHATSGGTLSSGFTHYNFNPVNYFQTPNTRYALGAIGHYEVSKALDIYARLTYSDNQTTTQLAPTPIFTTYNVNYGNPFLSAQERAIFFGDQACAATLSCAANDTASFGFRRRLIENGPRVDTFDQSAYQMVLGAKGQLGNNWSYDISAQYGHVLTSQHLTGDAQYNRFQQGLLVTAGGDCTDPSNGCVPINVFKSGGITPEAVKFFTLYMTAVTQVDQWDMVGSVTGDLTDYGIKSPWAKNGVSVNAGAEYRQEAAKFQPDQNLGTGNDLGFGQSSPVSGSYNVGEGFTEVRVPLIENMPFAELVSIDGAYRYSSYNLAGSTNTYKYSAEWQPVDDFRFRGSFERAVRAPNVNELFSAQSDSANTGKDPCSNAGAGVGASAALCVATGVPAGKVFSTALDCPSGQCEARVGGNPGLKPEVAKTRSLGVVFTPTFVDGFTATVDWFDINVGGYITQLPVATVLKLCYDPAYNASQSAAAAACQLIHRNAAGEIFGEPVPPGGYVQTLQSNIANYRVKGWDFDASYTSDLSRFGMDGWGAIAVNFKGTLMPTVDFKPDPTSGVQHCAGLYGDICPNFTPTPKWKHTMRVTWFSPDNDVSLSLLWRHIGGTQFDEVALSGKDTTTSCGYSFCDPLDAKIAAFNWFDLSGTWNVSDKVTLRAGVTNLFNKKPPIVDFEISAASADSGNTFPTVYDPVGRFMFIGATVKM